MTIPQPNSGKFACYGLTTRTSGEFDQPLLFDDGLYASATPPFFIDDWWREQLGELEMRRINECSLFITAISADPSADERFLLRCVSSSYYALLCQGVGYSPCGHRPEGMLLAGENTSDGMRVGSIGSLNAHYEPPKVRSASVRQEHFKVSVDISKGIKTIFGEDVEAPWQRDREDYLRLRKGFNSLLDGVKHPQAHIRLHQFVRALEAVIKPKQGEALKKFIYRCQFFAGRTTQDQKLLGELYEMRSAAEHLNPISDKLSEYPKHERDNLKLLRTYQAELLAGFVYRKVFTQAGMLGHFKSDESIVNFWQQQANDLITFWGNTINLFDAPKGRFFDYLSLS
jgi:hypothetical protein